MSPLHIDYRPNCFDEIIGNRLLKQSLLSVLEREDKPHSFLLVGPAGCGKTTAARLIAKHLECSELEFREYNAANTRGIDTIREIARDCIYQPLVGKVKVYLLDEAHQLSGSAAEALLKLLEDTPSYIYFILCTTLPEKIIETVKTRCSVYYVQKLISGEMLTLLNWILDQEGITISDKVKKTLIEKSEGCPRKMLVLLDQIIGMKKEEEQIGAIELSSLSEEGEPQIIDICRILIAQDRQKWEKISKLLAQGIKNPESARRLIMKYLSSVVVKAENLEKADRASKMLGFFLTPIYDSGEAGLIKACFDATMIMLPRGKEI